MTLPVGIVDTVALLVPVQEAVALAEDDRLATRPPVLDEEGVLDPEPVRVTVPLGVGEPVEEDVPVLEGEDELVDDTVALLVPVGDTL